MTLKPPPLARPPWVVLKFGGTSVAVPIGWSAILAACRATVAEGRRPLVVCSALAGVSDRIDALVTASVADEDAEPGLQAVSRAHVDLARSLDIPLPPEVEAAIDELRHGLAGIRLVREASPRVRARLLALGEQMSTRLGHAWLTAAGVDIVWRDARELLIAATPGTPDGPRFLSARDVTLHPDAARSLAGGSVLSSGGPTPGVLTQGFVASDAAGETVLLGRGGSDRSAALLGAELAAERVEIWTDVPGLFTANPSLAPRARVLHTMSYDEAEALGALGGRVLHPATVAPVRAAGVPLVVRSTFRPELPGTAVGAAPGAPGIKAVTARSGLLLLRMERPPQWQPVGFLADVSACFSRAGVSIDLLATSAARILATIDPAAAPDAGLDALMADLATVCTVEMRRPVASVSVVGTEVSRAAPWSSATLAALQAEALMVCPAASGLHLTFVVDEDRTRPVVEQLHRLLFESGTSTSDTLGPAWCELAEVAT